MEFNPISLDGEWFYLDVEIFHSKVFVYVGERISMANSAEKTLKEKFGQGVEAVHMADFIKGRFGIPTDGASTDVDSNGYDGNSFIRISSMRTGNLSDMLVFNHECLHVAKRIIDYVGIRDTGSNEALCYLHEHIFGKFMEQMCERGIGRLRDNTKQGDSIGAGWDLAVRIREIVKEIRDEALFRDPIDERMAAVADRLEELLPDVPVENDIKTKGNIR